jgi:hypothetical protein
MSEEAQKDDFVIPVSLQSPANYSTPCLLESTVWQGQDRASRKGPYHRHPLSLRRSVAGRRRAAQAEVRHRGRGYQPPFHQAP